MTTQRKKNFEKEKKFILRVKAAEENCYLLIEHRNYTFDWQLNCLTNRIRPFRDKDDR